MFASMQRTARVCLSTFVEAQKPDKAAHFPKTLNGVIIKSFGRTQAIQIPQIFVVILHIPFAACQYRKPVYGDPHPIC
jgi:hypothetical protein